MITFTVTTETRDQIALALVAHADDLRVRVALGRRLKKAEHPICIAGIVRHWPADADGSCRIAVNDVEGLMVWRAMAVADMAAGRDIHSDLAGRMGVRVEDALIYIRKFTYRRGHHVYAYNGNPCSKPPLTWTQPVQYILAGNPLNTPSAHRYVAPFLDGDPWRRNEFVMRDAGLMLEPVIHGDTYTPRASSLFLTPVPDVVQISLSIADDEALSLLAT
jgi:hypothetical protein